jgi:hypothetical protein
MNSHAKAQAAASPIGQAVVFPDSRNGTAKTIPITDASQAASRATRYGLFSRVI